MTSLAPVLSATSSRVCIWIMGRSRSARWRGGLRRARSRGPRGIRSGLGRLRLLLGGALALAGQRLLGAGADDPDDPPPLELRQRAGLHDLDDVADVGGVLLVVGVAD